MAWKIRERRPRSCALSCSVSYAGMSRIRFDGFAFASQPLRTPQRNWHSSNNALSRLQAKRPQIVQTTLTWFRRGMFWNSGALRGPATIKTGFWPADDLGFASVRFDQGTLANQKTEAAVAVQQCRHGPRHAREHQNRLKQRGKGITTSSASMQQRLSSSLSNCLIFIFLNIVTWKTGHWC